MHLTAAKTRFIQTWGTLASQWGINRTMAQIHALLLTAPSPLNTDQIMEHLQISRGNANMNIRSLIDWGLIYKEVRPGIRREYFRAEKDMWDVTRKIIRERKKREFDPLFELLTDLDTIEIEAGTRPDDLRNFKKVVQDLQSLNKKAELLYSVFQTIDRAGFSAITDRMVGQKEKG